VRIPALPGVAHRRTLANGLRVLVLENRQAPIVTTALTYRIGARDDPNRLAGLAHFLEHVMFKGSDRYAAGEIDAVAQRLGGDVNAMTWHDATSYVSQFAADRWHQILPIEADRMSSLRLDPVEVERERDVIAEEIATANDDPWQELEDRVHAVFFGHHPYGRPILGTAEALSRVTVGDLAEWHAQYYGPSNAVLTIAGDVGADALERAEAAFGAVPSRGTSRSPIGERRPGSGRRTLEVRSGTLPRWYAVLPCPHPEKSDFASVRMAAALLGFGRLSRLQQELVDQERLLTSVACTVLDTLEAGCVAISAEPSPGVTLEDVEAGVWRVVRGLVERPPENRELERTRRLLLSDWVFAHESISDQAVVASFAEACQRLDTPRKHLEDVVAADAASVSHAVERWLAPDRESTVGWCTPERS